ncbi:predicted protein [Sclerotinia sclerotiorum 1980 UF-70]|uniref:Uncharacterized protein n=1 Tax=Sclerotinia sclerotiorum (strain ATCC 18683 / 1980 / Ss-1) TaxID=665079 RepID=A7EBM6_SCLS1|nr:predicted protein [Sclerotinia sclerotiorum 1980 UF-70]EDN99854.1 predicted protein [Sclerotinia sclerotiorum 1980 UF-70]
MNNGSSQYTSLLDSGMTGQRGSLWAWRLEPKHVRHSSPRRKKFGAACFTVFSLYHPTIYLLAYLMKVAWPVVIHSNWMTQPGVEKFIHEQLIQNVAYEGSLNYSIDGHNQHVLPGMMELDFNSTSSPGRKVRKCTMT